MSKVNRRLMLSSLGGAQMGINGGGFLDSVGNFLKKVKPFSIADKILNDTGLGARLSMNPYGMAVLSGVKTGKSLGYGKRRRVRRSSRGGSKSRRRRSRR
jgi:hypothetical protein